MKPLITITTAELQWLLNHQGTATIGKTVDGVDYLISKQDEEEESEE